MTSANKRKWEFGGPIGVAAIMVVSHLLLYYLWLSITHHHGALVRPGSSADLGPFLHQLWSHLVEDAAPSWHAAFIYFGFLGFELLLAYTMPGIWVTGLPVPSEGHTRHRYLCNGAASWYVTLVTVALLHFSGVFRLTELADHLGPILTVAVLFANAVALAVYLTTIARRKQTRMSGNFVYDFFMGAVLNPRIGRVDLKFFIETRVSWILLFLLTLSAAAKHYQIHGNVSWPLIFMVVAHGLYTNACMKGEECIPTTWDIFHEKWGWMLIFWNLVGVPYVYSFNSYYLLVNSVEHSPWYMAALFALLLGAYYIWDTAQSQRNRFRMQERGTFVRRLAPPQLPWGTLHNPRHLKTANGGTLLIDGWWAYARKIHYTADILMALSWALSCGFGGILPYLYPVFFTIMIIHRAGRDEKRCRDKYGADWERYKAIVPGRFIPVRRDGVSRVAADITLPAGEPGTRLTE
jgi:delta24(24(1))-sterol reductase